jgi:hypothetical protein
VLPVPKPANLGSGSLDKALYNALLAPLLLPAAAHSDRAAARSSDQCYPPHPAVLPVSDRTRVLQLTEVEVEVVRAQHPTTKNGMRLLKAWVRFGDHEIRGTDKIPGIVCEVLVMAACRRDQLNVPYFAAATRQAAIGGGRPPGVMEAFMGGLELIATRLRLIPLEPAQADKDNPPAPVVAEVLYTAEQAERYRGW